MKNLFATHFVFISNTAENAYTLEEYDASDIDCVIAGTADNIVMVEGEMLEISEAEMVEIIKFGVIFIIDFAE